MSAQAATSKSSAAQAGSSEESRAKMDIPVTKCFVAS